MLALISPAKKIDFEADTTESVHTLPDFLERSEKLVNSARKLNRTQLASTMKISSKLAELNYKRFQDFSTPFNLSNAKQAALVFNGDTYFGLKATSMTPKNMLYAQNHLRILSGLYGLLRPLDLIQPYRLEMGSKFCPPGDSNLYGFWNSQLTDSVNAVTAKHKNSTVINLASNEYFKAIKPAQLTGGHITPVFKEIKNGEARTLGLFAKRARGAMARFMITKQIETPEKLKTFNEGGYQFRSDLSENGKWVFTREQE
ncbi:MAG: peroxide stress protein YaaA [Rhodospirillaceae bacterium TMED8]|nr:peroxide stress protein YaaA [Magnetovibrio sp.]OUT50854.1 MAG: peroxide stress protein YaaA [Rhodospirillaceae bacterium TMED8]|tara:strand:+ start:107 stop:880 length:774 start_codon:yes stop_codon:yes gene_type:complete